MSKFPAFLFISTIALISIVTVGACAASSPSLKPSFPEFNATLVSYPYEVQSCNATDPYTGTVTIYPGYLEANKSIQITIKNQHFIPYQLENGNWSHLYYNVRFKGHFYSGDWSYYPVKAGAAGEGGYIAASNSNYTIITLPNYLSLAGQPNGSKIDFQVQALVGYDEARYRVAGNTGDLAHFGMYFTGEASDWSNIQTLIIPEYSVPASGAPSEVLNQPTESTPSQSPPQISGNDLLFGLNWGTTAIVGLSSVAVLLFVSLMFLRQKRGR